MAEIGYASIDEIKGQIARVVAATPRVFHFRYETPALPRIEQGGWETSA